MTNEHGPGNGIRIAFYFELFINHQLNVDLTPGIREV